jgi:hypothetical protein
MEWTSSTQDLGSLTWQVCGFRIQGDGFRIQARVGFWIQNPGSRLWLVDTYGVDFLNSGSRGMDTGSRVVDESRVWDSRSGFSAIQVDGFRVQGVNPGSMAGGHIWIWGH